MFFLLTPLIRHMVVARDPDRMTSDDLDDNKWVSLTQKSVFSLCHFVVYHE